MRWRSRRDSIFPYSYLSIPLSGQAFISTVKSKRRGSARPASARPEAATPSRIPEPPPAEPAPEAEDAIPHPLEALARLDYVDAILLTGVRIAEGLAHAHERGIVHQDLKPANILITDEGLPMILDFNLARDTRSAVGAVRAQAGGTVPYMSPEQLEMFRDRTSTAEVDGRSDLYSLGLILAQLLTGSLPFPASSGTLSEQLPQMLTERRRRMPPLRGRNPAVGPAVESILRKCLEADPARRYQSAQEFIEDVERHRADLPLLHAPNPSLPELARKWVRRHPRLASPQTALVAVAVALLAVAGLSFQRTVAAQQNKFQALTVVGRQKLSDLETRTALAEQFLASTAEDAPRLEDGVKEGLAALEPTGALDDAAWLDRPEFAGLIPEERDRLRGNVGYLAYLLTRAGTSAGRPAKDLDARLRELGEGLKASPLAEGRGEFLRAVGLHGEGKYREAKALLVEFLRDNPDDVGGRFLLGRTHNLLGEFEDAYHAYSVCIALRPRFAPGYFNRALLSHEQHNYPRAVADLDSALKARPDSPEVLLVRSIVRLEMKQYPEALGDIRRVIGGENPPARAWFIRAAIHDKMGSKEEAAADRRLAMKQKATDADSRVVQGNERMAADDPKAALADYEAAEAMAPRAIAPLQNQANVEGEVFGRPERAVAILDRLLKVHPDYVPGLCGRAVYLARAGKVDEALAEAKRILALSDTPFTQYRVGCVYALASAKRPALSDDAFRQIARALQYGEGHAHLEADTDLAALRDRPAFEPLLGYVKHLRSLQRVSNP